MRAGETAGLLAAVAACGALYAWPISWGLPSAHGWAPDEITPAAVVDGASRRFGGGWHAKYPPLHFAVIAVAGAPWLGDTPGAERDLALFLAARTVSLLMACGIVACVYLCGRELYGHGPALFAALVAGLCAPLAYYAKVANVDAPYLFWFSAALLAWLRVLRAHRLRDYVALAFCAAAAVATKDQAYGLLVLMPVPILVSLRVRGAAGERPLLLDRRVLIGALAFAAFAMALTNAWLDPSGFAAHVRLITGSASRDFRMFEATPAGLAALAWAAVRASVFTLGAPAAAVAAAGLALALARRRGNGRLLATLAPAAGYCIFFLAVVLYLYDRFVLPLAIVAALFAGHALEVARDRARRPALPTAAAALVVAWSALRALSVDVLMARDSRYAAEEWLRRNAPPPALVAAVGPLEYLPRMDGLAWRRMGPSPERLARIAPDVVVVNADYARRAEAGGADAALFAALASGAAGYRLAHEEPATETLPFLDVRTFRSEDPRRVHSNLDKIGPPLLVFARTRQSGALADRVVCSPAATVAAPRDGCLDAEGTR